MRVYVRSQCRFKEEKKEKGRLRIYNKGLQPAFAMFKTLPDGLSQALPAFEENLTPHEENIDIPRMKEPQKPEGLQGDAALRHELLKIAKCKRPFSLEEARQIIKRRAKFRNYHHLSSSIKRATESLKRSKILVESRPPQTDHYIKKSNTCWVELAQWTSLPPEAQREVQSLRISRDNLI